MSERHDATTARYLERIFAARDRAPQPLTEAELLAIARELGLTDADLATALTLARQGRIRAEGYLKHRRWDDALSELEPAVALQPFDPEVQYLQARAHTGRWHARCQTADRQQAIALAKRCLELQPDFQPAFQLLNDLDQPPSGRLARAPRGALIVLAIAIAVGLPLAIIATALFLFVRQLPPPEPAAAPASAPPATEPNRPPAERAPDPTAVETGEFDILVEFEPPAEPAGVELDTLRSRLQIFPEAAYYKLQGRLVNASESELERLRVRLELLDAEGSAIETIERNLLAATASELRPGDRQAFGWTLATDPALDTVRLTAIATDATPAASRYAPSPSVPLAWENEPPAERQLAVRARQVRRPEYGDGLNHIATFELENTGDTAFEQLRLQIDYFDAAGKLLASRAPFAITSSEPPLLPGETRLLKTTQTQLPLDFDRYELTVIDWE